MDWDIYQNFGIYLNPLDQSDRPYDLIIELDGSVLLDVEVRRRLLRFWLGIVSSDRQDAYLTMGETISNAMLNLH